MCWNVQMPHLQWYEWVTGCPSLSILLWPCHHISLFMSRWRPLICWLWLSRVTMVITSIWSCSSRHFWQETRREEVGWRVSELRLSWGKERNTCKMSKCQQDELLQCPVHGNEGMNDYGLMPYCLVHGSPY